MSVTVALHILKQILFTGEGRNIEPPVNYVNEIVMDLPLTPREIEYIIAWRPQPFWPDEQRVLGKLHRALSAADTPKLSPFQVRIILCWVEEETGGHYGGGQVRNPEERAIVEKLETALAEAQV